MDACPSSASGSTRQASDQPGGRSNGAGVAGAVRPLRSHSSAPGHRPSSCRASRRARFMAPYRSLGVLAVADAPARVEARLLDGRLRCPSCTTGCSALGVRARARAALPRLPPAPTLPPDAVPGVPGDARPGAHLHAAPPPRSRRDRRRGAPGQGDRTWVTVASRPRWACLLPPSAAGSDASAVGPPSCGRWPPSWRTATTASWSDRRSGKPDRRRRRSTRRSRRSRRPPVRHGPVALAGDLRVGRHADALALTTAVVVIAIIDLSRRHLDVQGRRRDGRHAPRLDVHLDCRLVIKTSGAQHPARTPPTRRCC